MPPFKTLGTRLKYLRERSRESIAEVSGAVEIDEDKLARIEEGVERPSEDILMLLMSHFNMQDTEAVQVWELAGYDHRLGPDTIIGGTNAENLFSGKPIVMLLAVDVRTQYTDGVDIAADQAGLTLTFTQQGGPVSSGSQASRLPVSRVGMSLDQAEAVAQALQFALLRVKYARARGLPSPHASPKPTDTTLKSSKTVKTTRKRQNPDA